MKRLVLSAMLACVSWFATALYADLEIYSRTEYHTEGTLLKPRVYVRNNSLKPISDFSLQYYFTVEQGIQPVLEDYYTPLCAVSLKQIDDSQWYVEYSYEGVILGIGQAIPDTAGNSIGIHKADWSEWISYDDFSFENSDTFVRNYNIAVFDASGRPVCGNMPAVQTAAVSLDYTGITMRVKNDAYWDQQWIKPSLQIENNSSENLSNFTVWYYFTAEEGKTPVLETWWVPDATASLRRLGGL